MVDQVQQGDHHALVHLVLVWKHKGVCGRLQTPQMLSSRTLRPSQQAFEAGTVSYPMLSEEAAQRQCGWSRHSCAEAMSAAHQACIVAELLIRYPLSFSGVLGRHVRPLLLLVGGCHARPGIPRPVGVDLDVVLLAHTHTELLKGGLTGLRAGACNQRASVDSCSSCALSHQHASTSPQVPRPPKCASMQPQALSA